ncbi:MAG: tetratricopeptide repeat protein [Ktedonobacteraceae bacterium]|nr:tetratricopeptide repeat protein [Ktedonobacteraceae bacterium]
MTEPTAPHKDFFISYTSNDGKWAEWIAAQLEDVGYSTIIQAWDIRPGMDFVQEMDKATRIAKRTIAVLSPDYFHSRYTPSEWHAAFRRDPTGEQALLLPIRVETCDVEGLLGSIVYIDLAGLDEQHAHDTLLAGVLRERAKPPVVPFPAADQVHPQHTERPPFPGTLPPIWNVPYQRNTFFTGRDELLAQLATTLQSGEPTALSQPQAISGLGGIGKTQLALEYAYRHRQHYNAVLWAQADTREALTSSFTTIVGLLNLPEKNEQDVNRIIVAVKRWLQKQGGWLLVLDNADNLALAKEFVPPAFNGHLLLTTRVHATGRFAHHLEVDVLTPEHGALFLLRRSGLVAPNAVLEQACEAERTRALAICDELGALPLALDQAGAYIEETGCSLADYQAIYQQRRKKLHERCGLGDDYPQSVATTWSLSFERVEQTNAAAADLLRLCAFLAPEAIPLELLSQGAAHLGPQLAPVAADAYLLNQAIESLLAYSLVGRDAGSNTLSVHRLVQAVLKDAMSKQTYQQWAERAVGAVDAAFPEVEFRNWPQCERCLPHAQTCAALIEQEHMIFLEAAGLLNETGRYLYERGLYVQAEPLYQRALRICEHQLGPDHPATALSLNNLVTLYHVQGQYAQAEPLYQRALRICEHQLGPNHPDTALSLNNLAELYRAQGKFADAELLY